MPLFLDGFLQLPAVRAGTELLLMLLTDPRSMTLFLLLAIAAISDFRSYRIPNWLTVGGTVVAFAFSAFHPAFPHPGFLSAAGGFAIGLAVMFPAYALRVMGAGDVKLMAMIGAFLGAADVLYAIVSTFIVGGVAALAFALYRRALGRMIGNLKAMTEAIVMSAAAGMAPGMPAQAGRSIGRMPYGVSIALGTAGYVVARQFGFF